MRKPLFDHQPETGEVSLSVLIGVANAIERESMRRYDALADLMQRRGDAATAEAFRAMRDEERAHVDAVEYWAGTLGEPVPDTADFKWRLPPEMASAWSDVAGSALLSPYRAYAIAADNEQRAFALYSYLASQASDPAVAAQAERLALEELRHASLMRRWRRKAWHRERRQLQAPPPTVPTQEALDSLLAQREAGIARRHRAVAAALRAQGDEESARLLEDELSGAPLPPSAGEAASYEDTIHGASVVSLLVRAQEPLEALSETLEGIMRSSEGRLFTAAETALARVVRRLGRLALQIERRMRA
ncbi:ferritin family protein [uncultured Azohydromonas sp.]|jgi:Rubrerythrin.|uniref:ferritin-like domain-containing protein n=1 Tax=uncultured Azohydromonas sp. TaxID=487342 RepID=UPI00261716D7|nr:ferritin family protein [uncultured Azohydromonas sp.]